MSVLCPSCGCEQGVPRRAGLPGVEVHKPGCPGLRGGRVTTTVKRRGGFRTRYRVRWARVLAEMLRPSNVREAWCTELEVLTEAQHMEDLQRVCPHEPGMLDWMDDGQWAHCRGCSGVVSMPVEQRWGWRNG